MGKGTPIADTMWNLDGVVITDVNSGGASSSYYDFNAFEEVNISTGGNDLRQQTGGIGINFVTRRGTNKFKGTVYVADNNHKMESTNVPSELTTDSRLKLPSGAFADKANHSDNGSRATAVTRWIQKCSTPCFAEPSPRAFDNGERMPS